MKKCLVWATFGFALFFSAVLQAQEYQVGERVEVFRGGRWNPGEIAQVKEDLYEVSFYSSYKNCKETLPASRLRASDLTDKKNPVVQMIHTKKNEEQVVPAL